jgi:hypothetical protein
MGKLKTDLDGNGISDGYRYTGLLTDFKTDDGYDGDYCFEMSIGSGDSLIIDNIGTYRKLLFGFEEGLNTVGLAVKGVSSHDSVIVEITGFDVTNASVTTRLAFPVASTSWTWVSGDYLMTYPTSSYAGNRGRAVKIYAKSGTVRVSAPLIKKKY